MMSENLEVDNVDSKIHSESVLVPTNLQESCRIISNELQKHGEFYDAFVSCVERTLDEYDDENCVIDDGYFSSTLARKIVKRISGEE